MNSTKLSTLLLAVAILSGCAAAWIAEPSQATENLVHDLKIEGFECRAGVSTVTCRQKEPFIERSSKVCTGSTGCVKQPCHDMRIVYEISQSPSGMPLIKQSTERQVTTSITPSDVISGDRLKVLQEYCAL